MKKRMLHQQVEQKDVGTEKIVLFSLELLQNLLEITKVAYRLKDFKLR
jgi:hypothetical protein